VSTFLIIQNNVENHENDLSRAISLYSKINPKLPAQPPKIYSKKWGILIYWEGPDEKLASWQIDSTGDLDLNLGWNPHAELALGIKTAVLSAKTGPVKICPIQHPEYNSGIYSVVKATADYLVCIPDPYSSYPIYHLLGKNNSFISNDPVLTLAMAREVPILSKEGIIERLLTEGNIGENYIFKNLPRLKPGEWISASENNIYVNSYQFKINKITQEEFEKNMVEQFKKLANLSRPIIFKLTGGWDSRLNLALAIKAGLNPLCFTFKSLDSPTAARLSEKLGLLHVHVDSKGDPIDYTSPAAIEYEKIRSKAIFISGANASTPRAHYLKSESDDIRNEKETVITNYLGYKRRAMLSKENFKTYYHIFLQWWNYVSFTENNWWYSGHQYDALYIERCRTFGGEAWANPAGAVNIAPLAGPILYGYGLGFTPAQRAKSLPHETITKSCLGEYNIEYFRQPKNIPARFFNSLPLIFKVTITRFLYKYRYKKLPNDKKLSEDTFAQFKDILSRGEMEALYLNRKHYVDEVSNMIKRSRLIEPS
jgi:hypothetical protein